MIVDEKYIWAYGLKNGLEHEGKAVTGSVIPALFNHGLTKDKIKEVIPKVNDIIKKVNSMDILQQQKEFEKYSELIGHRPERGDELPELTNIGKKGVIMRFAPSPSGPMHIGHVITGMLSSLYVQKYGGKFYFRIEDTNPENIYPKAYDMLKEEADWIFGNVTEYSIQSDRLGVYYDYLERLFELDSIYVCTCDNEKFKKLIENSKACPCRELSREENIKKWKKMLDKKGYKDGEAVVRFKSDLKVPNPAMRDFPLARINSSKHPRQGKKYRVWPLMNLAVTVDDIETGVTHSIRAKDHRDNAIRQKMIYNVLKLALKFPNVYFSGRYNFTDLELSASKTRELIEKGKFSGWDDIRLPFVAALKKRGYQKEAFEKLVILRGLSEVDKVISREDFFSKLDEFNRGILRDKVKKYDFVKTNEKDSNIIILMPDNSKVYGKSDVKPKEDEIVYFDKTGYSKYNSKEGKKSVFWFCHK